MFNRISGITAISGAVDSSFTLVEEQRGSGRARLSCIGRDIGYQELEPRRGSVWKGAVPNTQTGPAEGVSKQRVKGSQREKREQ